MDIRLITGFGSVPAETQEGIRGLLHDALEQIGREEGSFTRAKAVFTESDEQCVFTVELDGVRKEPSPLVLDLGLLEDALADPGQAAVLKERLRDYCRRVRGPSEGS